MEIYNLNNASYPRHINVLQTQALLMSTGCLVRGPGRSLQPLLGSTKTHRPQYEHIAQMGIPRLDDAPHLWYSAINLFNLLKILKIILSISI
jgi:hypothetical protein